MDILFGVFSLCMLWYPPPFDNYSIWYKYERDVFISLNKTNDY